MRRDGDQERGNDRRIGASLGSSVRATHLFLSESEIDRIKGYVPQALRQVQHLLVDSAGKVNGNFGIRTKNVCKNHVFGTNASQKVVKGAKSRRARLHEVQARFSAKCLKRKLRSKR